MKSVLVFLLAVAPVQLSDAVLVGLRSQTARLLNLKRIFSAGKELRRNQHIGEIEDSIVALAKDGMSNSTQLFVQQLSALIQNETLPQLVSQRDTAVKEIESLYANFDNCRSLLPPSSNGSVEMKKPFNWDFYSKEHKSCRTNQSIAATEVVHYQVLLSTANQTQNLTCLAFDAVNHIPDDDECGVPGQDMRLYASHLVQKFKAKYDNWLSTQAACQAATADAQANFHALQAAQDRYNTIKGACNAIQDMMDNTACAFRLEVNDTCSCYNNCMAQASSVYADAVNRTTSLQAILSGEYRSLLRIECVLKAFAGDDLDGEIAKCQTASFDLSPVAIPMNTSVAPPQALCQTAQPYLPNSEVYIKNEYAPLPATAPAKACQATPCCNSR